MSGGEVTILVSSGIGFLTILVQQWSANKKVGLASSDAIEMRKQDRLDRESLARGILEQQQLEIARLEANNEAARLALGERIADTEKLAVEKHDEVIGGMVRREQEAREQAQEIKSLVIENTAVTKETGAVSKNAFEVGNELNLWRKTSDERTEALAKDIKLMGAAIESVIRTISDRQPKQDAQADRVESVVGKTHDSVEEVREILTPSGVNHR